MYKNLRKKILKTVSFTLVFVFSIAAAAFAQTNSSSKGLDYVALGDSLAAGQTPYGVENGYGYTNIIHNELAAAGLGGSFHNYGVSGYTSQDILNQLNSGQAGMIQSIKNAEIVTLDVGANDILHLQAIKDLLSNTNPALYPALLANAGAAVNAELPNIGARIAAIIGLIEKINPQAKIYVMGYYNAFMNTPYSADLSNVIMGLNYYIYQATILTNSNYVDTMAVVNNPAYLPGDIHPTVDGYNAIATAFVGAIK